MTPMQALLQSRKFLILLLDTAISLVLFFVGKYALAALEDIKFIILALQPVALMLIYAIAKEDAAEKSAAVWDPGANGFYQEVTDEDEDDEE